MTKIDKSIKELIYKSKVIKREYTPKIYFMLFDVGTWRNIDWQIAYTEDEAIELSYKEELASTKTVIKNNPNAKVGKSYLKDFLSVLEEGQSSYKKNMVLEIPVEEMLANISEYMEPTSKGGDRK